MLVRMAPGHATVPSQRLVPTPPCSSRALAAAPGHANVVGSDTLGTGIPRITSTEVTTPTSR